MKLRQTLLGIPGIAFARLHDPLDVKAGDQAGGGGMFDGAALPKDKPFEGTPELTPPAETTEKTKDGAPDPSNPQEAKAEPKADASETAEPEKTEAEEAKAPPTAEPKLLAGKFKTPEQLEIAYQHSTREGLRNYALLKEANKRIVELEADISRRELEAEVGQFQERTPEELAELSDTDKRVYKVEKDRYLDKKREIENRAKEAKAKEQQAVAKELEELSENADYQELDPIMGELLDRYPHFEVKPLPGISTLLYMAALGIRELNAKEEAKKASQASAEEAKRKASSDATRSGTSGGPGMVTTPASGKPKTGSLDDFNQSILSAGPKALFA